MKNADRRRPLQRPMANPDAPPDLYAMAALGLGMLGMCMRMRLAVWAACFSCLGLLSNLSSQTCDWKQVVCSITFSVSGLVISYVPQPG